MAGRGTIEAPRFYFSKPDIYDSAPWTDMDIFDLRAGIEAGDTLEEGAGFLCRADTADEVARKAEELGLKWQQPNNG
jgi:hypothetical protein